MKLSYAILVYNEVIEIQKLINQILEFKDEEDEIVVLVDNSDSNDVLDDVLNILGEYRNRLGIKQFTFDTNSLNKDFSQQKNYLTEMCTGDFIVNVDADEEFHKPKQFFGNIKSIIETNPQVELFEVPRINIVNGIRSHHIKKWGWRLDEQERVNYPDYQKRIYKNDYPRIEWVKPVHEHIAGHTVSSKLPTDSVFDLLHVKDIKRQTTQNEFYDTIV